MVPTDTIITIYQVTTDDPTKFAIEMFRFVIFSKIQGQITYNKTKENLKFLFSDPLDAKISVDSIEAMTIILSQYKMFLQNFGSESSTGHN